VKSGPEVSFVGMTFPLSRARKRLTRTGAGPNRSVIGPSGQSERVAPSGNAGEEVTLPISFKVLGGYVENAAVIDMTGGDQARLDQVAQPVGCKPIIFVIVGGTLCRIRYSSICHLPKFPFG
jgi:hypothetical protein